MNYHETLLKIRTKQQFTQTASNDRLELSIWLDIQNSTASTILSQTRPVFLTIYTQLIKDSDVVL